MGSRQTPFLLAFQEVFIQKFDQNISWLGGQKIGNYACLIHDIELRRNGKVRAGERFELGDLRGDINGTMLIIEYDSSGVSLSNLTKFWPFLRGELSVQPSAPLILCHFSDWSSYGSHRDLWEWQLSRIKADADLLMPIYARQFDHGRDDLLLRALSLEMAINWVIEILHRETSLTVRTIS